MENNFFKVLRGGTHSTFQDNGFFNKQHLGITVGGAIDNELYRLSNNILNNSLHLPVLEFCIQGPSLQLMSGKSRIVITGNVFFNIKTSIETFRGVPNKSYLLNEGDIIDIISTIKSNYGYLSVDGGFKIKKSFGSYSTLTTSVIGANQGKKIAINQHLQLNDICKSSTSQIKYSIKEPSKYIRVIPGPQMNFFFPKEIKKFFEKEFKVSNNLNRMGIRLEGNPCKAIKSNNIPSEGIIKGSIQVPSDGNPIILMNDHPTIGGYPKIAIIILADLSKTAQFTAGSLIKFKLITLREAELIYRNKLKKINKFLGTNKYNEV